MKSKALSPLMQKMLDLLHDGERVRIFPRWLWGGTGFAAVDRSGIPHLRWATANGLLQRGYLVDTGKRQNCDATTSGQNTVIVCKVRKNLRGAR